MHIEHECGSFGMHSVVLFISIIRKFLLTNICNRSIHNKKTEFGIQRKRNETWVVSYGFFFFNFTVEKFSAHLKPVTLNLCEMDTFFDVAMQSIIRSIINLLVSEKIMKVYRMGKQINWELIRIAENNGRTLPIWLDAKAAWKLFTRRNYLRKRIHANEIFYFVTLGFFNTFSQQKFKFHLRIPSFVSSFCVWRIFKLILRLVI